MEVQVRARLNAALRDAMRARDAVAMSALRGALSAIGNAEAVPALSALPGSRSPAAGGPHIAGAVAGLGAAEVPRRSLSAAQVAAIVAAEISERESAAAGYEAAGVLAEAERLRREISVLRSVMAAADQES